MSKKFKIKRIILEGCDEVGKTTFKKLFNKLTGSKHCVIDRLYGSLISYGHFRHRHDISFKKYYQEDTKLSKDGSVVIYLYADMDDLIQRVSQSKDKDITIDEIPIILSQYNNYLKHTKMRVIKINTSKLDKQQMVEFAIKKLNSIGDNYYESKN